MRVHRQEVGRVQAAERAPGLDVLVRQLMKNLAGKALLFLDTCHAGQLYPGRGYRGLPDLSRFVNELTSTGTNSPVFTPQDVLNSSDTVYADIGPSPGGDLLNVTGAGVDLGVLALV